MRVFLFLLPLAACASAATPGRFMGDLASTCMAQDCYFGTDGATASVTVGTLPSNLTEDQPPHRGCIPAERPALDMAVREHVVLQGLGDDNPLMAAAEDIGCSYREAMGLAFGPYCTVRYVPKDAPIDVPMVRITALGSGESRTFIYHQGTLRTPP